MSVNYFMQILKNHNLKPYTSFGVDAYASQFITVTTLSELKSALQISAPQRLILGGGSNLLFCDDFDGLVIRICLTGITVNEAAEDAVYLHVAAGENWHEFVQWTLAQGYDGLENLALIPGVVGAAPVQNIGAYGVELKDVCDYVDVLDIDTLMVRRYTPADCQFGYRDSIFKGELKDSAVITAVGIKLHKPWIAKINYGPLASLGDKTSALAIFKQVCLTRQQKLPDPNKLGNAGSFFKNPIINKTQFNAIAVLHPNILHYPAGGDIKLAAGWLIDQCALKGYQQGGAQVHTEQALVIVNTGTATAADIVALAKHIQTTVQTRFGVELQHEVRFMGRDGETSLAEVCRG
ncbi:UDP-N-acetylmuramate dehydrogenase [Moritella yayanosii]|uniref:UDP-N-acetylenolpyruvoylglucosamine reductase n=1 Tax=Moritella yayanosii TaxID=69539 RepID=A0A330LQF4_9GAMM|nr:UDP-N-acetylmuramate dehydrogenase [Moritella yayanosii]SQD79224.1 UDP-N-acetylenolpyruvoylglucosamine reductase, FAD-binding [Moritella yayanosii]